VKKSKIAQNSLPVPCSLFPVKSSLAPTTIFNANLLSAGYFQSQGYTFDVGASMIFGMGNKGTTKQTLFSEINFYGKS
jgi:hypothetical protein